MSPYAAAVDLGIQGVEATIRTKRSKRFRRLPRLLSSHQLSLYWVFRRANVSIGQGEGVLVIADDPLVSKTFMRSLCGLLPADEGYVQGDSRSILVSTPRNSVVRGLSVRQAINVLAGLYGMSDQEIDERIDEVIEMAQVKGILSQRIEDAPGHVKQQIAFSLAMVAPVDLLAFPDRPRMGAPQFRSKCAGRLAAQKQRGRGLLMTDADINLATTLCTTAVFLDEEESRTMPMGEALVELERRAKARNRRRNRRQRSGQEDRDEDDSAGF